MFLQFKWSSSGCDLKKMQMIFTCMCMCGLRFQSVHEVAFNILFKLQRVEKNSSMDTNSTRAMLQETPVSPHLLLVSKLSVN